MKVSRFLSLFAILALVLTITPAVFAQDETFGLSDEDYQLFLEINNNSTSSSIDSLRFEIDTAFAVTGMGEDEISGAFTGSGSIADGAFEFSFDGEAVVGVDTTPVNLEIRLVDESLYLSTDGGETWQGGTTDEIGDELTQSLGGLMGMAGMSGTDSAASTDDMMAGAMQNPAAMQALGALSSINPGDFIAFTRVPGDDISFSVDLDIAELLSSDAILPLLSMGMTSAMGGSGADSTATMTEAEITQMQGMVEMLVGDATFNVTQTADASTQLVQSTSIALDFPIPSMLTGGQGSGGNIAFNLDIRLPEYNGAVNIEAPASFEPFEMNSMMSAGA